MKVKSKVSGLDWNLDATPAKTRQAGMYSLYVPHAKSFKGGYIEVTSKQLIDNYMPIGVYVDGHVALYGIISCMGDTWTVVYRKEGQLGETASWWTTREQSGDGDIPFDRFPDIPIIDFTNNDAMYEVCSLNYMIEEARWDHTNLGIWQYVPLLEYLNECVKLGIPVYGVTHSLSDWVKRHRR